MGLLSHFVSKPRKAPFAPAGTTLYAVGDVHGRLDLLERLTEQILEDAAADAGRADARPQLILLGDYIDRGPASKGVVDHLLGLRDGPLALRTLKGNHEYALLAFLEDARIGPGWSAYGGLDTLKSYLGWAPAPAAPFEAWEEARIALLEALPGDHLAFYKGLELYAIYGDYFFVHAGARPGVPLDQQAEMDLLTIREDFLSSRRPFSHVIVYGHTPEVAPVIEADRIGIDTGAYATGVLSCVKLQGDTWSILQARG